MANKKSKDYSVGNPKKGLTLLAIVVLIAIIIVLIIIFIPANTSNAKVILHNVTSTSYLQDKEEITSYEKIGEKLQNSTKNYYMEEYNNVPILSSTIDKVLEFYDEYLVFAKDNKVLSNNYSAIKKNLNKVISQQKKLNNIVKNVVNLEQDSDSYLQNLWIDYREEYANWLEYNANAISALSKCYEGCFENTLTNNKASKIVLDTINDYLSSIINGYNNIVSSDLRNSNNVYTYSLNGQILSFSNFVEKYIVDYSDITNYYFNDSIKTKYDTIIKFYENFEQESFIVLIQSMDNSGNITKTFEVEDTEGVLVVVKTFIEARG